LGLTLRVKKKNRPVKSLPVVLQGPGISLGKKGEEEWRNEDNLEFDAWRNLNLLLSNSKTGNRPRVQKVKRREREGQFYDEERGRARRSVFSGKAEKNRTAREGGERHAGQGSTKSIINLGKTKAPTSSQGNLGDGITS